ncbi:MULTISPECIES: superoxide dismutase family protein [unclassified Caballeronia]|uniref:superoxide dismutase family protein n=1 Tax=unclassified Caballeronia TaxID=2646786 RepID=UPI0028558E74|nr:MULTISPECIES: superoxide dismutase family protein [unclassified Caballeronia]MDR5749835.1 superoxide dismutase family protein [Caballeronia sp. LZ024]MDR5843037.1 superoxide dismutase family protein [Caballeronia sp. LZ031]
MRQRFDGWSRAALIAMAASTLLLSGCGIIFQNHEKRADATLLPTPGSATRGTVTLIERADGVQISYNLAGMPPNSEHALQVHERGDCIVTSQSDAGPVFALAADRKRSSSRAEGDLANIRSDANGTATGFIVATDVSLDGVRSVVSRALILHRDASDPYVIGPHSAGPALACGVVRQ